MLLKSLAHPTGFEPVTSAFGGHWVNKISQRYQTVTVSQGDCIGFVNALRLGIMTFADGDKYLGEFKDDLFHGQGTSYDADGSVIKKGRWENGNFVEEENI